MLKEVVKKAKIPAKSRVVPPDVVVRYRDQIQKLATEIKSILKEEKEEKELRVSEMEMNKARNMLEHEREIYSRPPRTWIQPNARKRPAPGTFIGEPCIGVVNANSICMYICHEAIVPVHVSLCNVAGLASSACCACLTNALHSP